MSYLLRRTRKAVWVGEERSRDGAVNEFARTDADTDGLSVFEVETDAQRTTVVAAFACERMKASRLDIIEVERETLERYGPIAFTPEKGTTHIPSANELHRSLDWDGAALRRLAEALFDEGRVPREYTRTMVRAALCSIDPDVVVDEDVQEFVRAEQDRTRRAG